MGLISLPTEILTHIFSNLTWKDILRLNSACKTIHDLCSSTPLQYHTLLAIAGYDNGPSNNLMPVLQRLDLLKKLEYSFNYASFSHKERIEFPGRFIPSYDLQGGVFVQGRHGTGTPYKTFGVNAYKLPSPLDIQNSGNSISWKLPDLERPSQDLSLDASQDLLVLVEGDGQIDAPVMLHFMSLTTGKGHPFSAGSYLVPSQNTTRAASSFVFNIMGPFVGLLWGHLKYIVCNWKTGKTHVEISTSFRDPIDSSFFLDQERFALIRGRRNPVEIEIYKFITHEDSPQNTACTAIYHLPINGLYRMRGVYCRSDPSPMIGTMGSNAAYSVKPFTPRLEDRAIVIDIMLHTDDSSPDTYLVVVRGETLMNVPEDAKTDNGIYIIGSELWMHQTYSESTTLRDNWACFVYGSRFIKISRVENGRAGDDEEDEEYSQKMEVTIMDINPRLVAWAEAKGCSTTPYAEGCHGPFNRTISRPVSPTGKAILGQARSKLSVIATRFTAEDLKVQNIGRFAAMLDGERFIALYMHGSYYMDVYSM
ncbi:hypothetical protein FRC20_009053 [Serendipita sp. 405]|nr:hypothetical protein FRC20_009053 [Serendipita sp. 405]